MLTQVERKRVIDVLLEVPGQVAVLVVQRPYEHLQNTNNDVYCIKHCMPALIATAIMSVCRNSPEVSSNGRSIILVFPSFHRRTYYFNSILLITSSQCHCLLPTFTKCHRYIFSTTMLLIQHGPWTRAVFKRLSTLPMLTGRKHG